MKNPIVKWVIYILGAAVAFSLASAGGIFFLLTRLDMRGEVERIVESATHRDLTITGDVGVSFYPVIGIRADDASLANVPGGRAPALASVKTISLGVEILPLVLRRDVIVRRLVLTDPRIALEIDAAGEPNWSFERRPPGQPSPPSAPPVNQAPPPQQQPQQAQRQFTLREVVIDNGEISYFDARKNGGWSVADVDMKTSVQSLDAPIDIAGSLNYAGQNVELDVTAAAPRAILSGAKTRISATIGSELLEASFDGELATETGDYAGDVEATGPNLRRVIGWLVAPIEAGYGLEAFSVTGKIATGDREVSFENAAFHVDQIAGRGDFVLREFRNKPYVSGRLEVFDVDLNPYLAAATRPSANREAIAEAAAAPARVVDVTAPPTETPFDFAGLKAINADLEITTGPLKIHRIQAQRTLMSLVINDGYLASTIHRVDMYGGSGRGRLEFDARLPEVRIVQELVADGVEARGFLSDAFGYDKLEGRTELNLNVRMNGQNQSSLIRSLDGRATFELRSGVLHGVDLGGVATTIRRALNNDLVSPNARTQLTGMSASFAIADGVMGTENISFNTPDLQLRGLGVIDLPQRTMDVRVVPQRAVLAIPFRVSGPWGAFRYESDVQGRARRELEPRVRAIRAASR
ncbi:MAG: AsmA family protein [Caulobacterales bacterium]